MNSEYFFLFSSRIMLAIELTIINPLKIRQVSMPLKAVHIPRNNH